jgi:hypothetical protein
MQIFRELLQGYVHGSNMDAKWNRSSEFCSMNRVRAHGLTMRTVSGTLAPMMRRFIRTCLLSGAVLLLSPQAYGGNELKAYDAYFCPALELTDEQKSELIPHIRKRHSANQQNKFKDRTDATVFGVDLSQSKAAKGLNRPEDRAVRKIIDFRNARKLETWLAENEDRIERVKADFPLLDGEFLEIRQDLHLSEDKELSLKIALKATVPSAKYRLVMDEMKREGDALVLKMSIVRPHPFMLFEETPSPQQLAREMKVDLPHPRRVRIAVREISEFETGAEYPAKREEPVLQPSDL